MKPAKPAVIHKYVRKRCASVWGGYYGYGITIDEGNSSAWRPVPFGRTKAELIYNLEAMLKAARA